jgi:MATE family multidrug resistance protein
MVRLALPVVIAELGWITMGIVDTVMVGPLGPAALGAVGTGSTMFFALVVLGMGTLLALDTFVSQGFGAGQIAECHRWLLAGLQLAAVMSVALVVVALVGVALLPRAGLHPAVIVLLQPYLASLLWSIPPLLAFTVFRRYLQAMHVVRSVMAALISANLINVAANWALVYGHLGLPAFGVVGSAYATLAARCRAGDARGRGLRRSGRVGRAHHPGRAGGQPDRPQHRRIRVHGAIRPRIGGRRARRPRGG